MHIHLTNLGQPFSWLWRWRSLCHSMEVACSCCQSPHLVLGGHHLALTEVHWGKNAGNQEWPYIYLLIHLLKYIYILQVWVYVKAYLVHVCISLYFIHGLFSLHHQHTYHTHPMVVAALLLSTGKALLLSIKTLNLLLSCCFPSSWSLRPPPELPRAQLEKPMPRSVTSLLSPVPDWIKK